MGFNTHFDHVGMVARQKSGNYSQKMKELQRKRTILQF